MKEKISDILGRLLEIAKDTRTWLKCLVFIITLFAGAILFSRTRVKKEDCTACNNERKELIQALIGIKKDLQAVSYNGVEASFVFASYYDTLPKKQQSQQQQRQIKKVIGKIDSLLMKYQIPQDTIKKDSITKKTKNNGNI